MTFAEDRRACFASRVGRRAMWGALGVVSSVVLGCSGKTIQTGSASAGLGGSSADGDRSTASGASSVSGSQSDEGGRTVLGGSGNSDSQASGSTGSESTASAGSLSADPCSASAPFACVSSCAVQHPSVESPSCDGGRWLCPAGTQSVLDCATDSCAVRLQSCCDRVLGNLATPCGADGRVAPCAADQIPNVTLCVPAGTVGGSCPLSGLPCLFETQFCNADRLNCHCQATDGGLAWTCTLLPG